jgi:DNA-binding beta-propeller fold protein YncE
MAALTVCAGCASANPSANPATPSAHRAGGWLSGAAKKATGLIYVSDFTNNDVEIYSSSGSNQSPIGEITDGISGPEGSFVDKRGNLYVTNVINQTVTMYPRGSTTYTMMYTGFAYPVNVTVGADGTVYVVDLVGQKVVEFPPGTVRSKRTIDIEYPQGAALDSKNDLYVSYNTGSHGGGPGTVQKYAPKSKRGQNLTLPIVWAAGDDIDGSGDVVVADQGSGSGNAAVYVFPPGSKTPSLTITQGIEDPFRLAFDKKFAHLYVADAEANEVLVYDYPSGKLVNTISSGLKTAFGVAVSPEGN